MQQITQKKHNAKFIIAIISLVVVMLPLFFMNTQAAERGYIKSLDGYFSWPLKAPYTASQTAKATKAEWDTQGTKGIPSAYQWRNLGGWEFHDAIDIWAAEGTPIYAAASGKIFLASYDSTLGNYIYIKHNNGYYTRYCHMKGYAKGISTGKSVQKGQLIGYVGHTGRCIGPSKTAKNAAGSHLDFAICDSSFLGCTNPLYYFGNELKEFANNYYKKDKNALGNGTQASKNQIWNFPKTTTITKTIAVSKISLNKTSETVTVGNTIKLTATISPSNATNKNITWTSSNNKIATVSGGVVKGINTGTATITATANGKKVTCKVTVKAKSKTKTIAVTKLTLNKSSVSIEAGNTTKLTATVSPSNATNKNVTWTSSNTNVVTVDSTGNIKGVKAGTATITAQTKDNGKTATCKITVKAVSYKTGLYNSNGVWKYYENGKIKSSTGLVQKPADGKWYYVKNGVFTTYTGWVKKVKDDGYSYWVNKGIYTGSKYKN